MHILCRFLGEQEEESDLRAEGVVNDLEYLVSEYYVDAISFMDSNKCVCGIRISPV
jgi:hypothetical protein